MTESRLRARRDAAGSIVITAASTEPLLLARATIRELEIAVDLLSPARPADIIVDDLEAADPQLRDLFGSAAVDGWREQPNVDTPAPEPDPEFWAAIAGPLRVSWMQDWAPAAFDPELLDLDFVHLAAPAGTTWPDAHTGVRLERSAGRLARLSSEERTGRLTPVAARLVRNLDAVAGGIGSADSGAPRPDGSARRTVANRAWWPAFRRVTGLAAALGAETIVGSAPLLRGSVDRRLVPPGYLADAEDTIQALSLDARTIEISVPAAVGTPMWFADPLAAGPDDPVLIGRVVAADSSLPILDIELRPDEVGCRYVGVARANRPLRAAGDVVDVVVSTCPLLTETDVRARLRARARRTAARAFVAQRLAVAGGSRPQDWAFVAAAWETARRDALAVEVTWAAACRVQTIDSWSRSGREDLANRFRATEPGPHRPDPLRLGDIGLAELDLADALYTRD